MVIPNTRPMKQQADPGVMIAIRAPDADVQDRVKAALERSRKINAKPDSEMTSPLANAAATDDSRVSNRRTYSAKQEDQLTNPMLSTDTRERDAQLDEQNRKISAHPKSMEARLESDLTENGPETSLKFHATKQGDQNAVDVADVRMDSNIQDIDKSGGYDPSIQEAANMKKHIAREGSITTESMLEMKNEESEKTGLETNTRARVPLIETSMEAKAIKPVIFKRIGDAGSDI